MSEKQVPQGSIIRTPASDIPSSQIDGALPSRDLRGAWNLSGRRIVVDMAKAREIWRDRIRAVRNVLLAEEDVKFMRAIEEGVNTADIIARKIELRAAPQDPAIDTAATPEELMAVWPACLGPKPE